jgi:D-lactate dehydrogenase (cytochrome)
LDVTVQAGLGYIELNEVLKPLGLWFPLDPGPGASIGGMCATRCSGSTAVRYGSMRDNVLNLTAVMADGTIIRTGSRARKSSAGYDITRLLIGSEGTLAVITEATLKVYPLPVHSHAVRISFPRLEAAARCASDTLRAGLSVGRCELIDEVMVRDINAANPRLAGGAWPEQVTLLYELTGQSLSAVQEQTLALSGLATHHGATALVTASDPAEVAQVWKTRKECLWSTMSQHPDQVRNPRTVGRHFTTARVRVDAREVWCHTNPNLPPAPRCTGTYDH